MSAAGSKLVLLTGATGYVGGRLLPRLESAGYAVRCLARRPEFLSSRIGPNTEVVAGDVFNPDSLRRALRGVATAYYLIHSMDSGEGFEAADRRAAEYFARAAAEAGVRRIIYLGGLGDSGGELSPHLYSRHEVGRILRESTVQVIEFRASIVIGSGSLSFELVRALVERLPVMITPRWVSVEAQPIAISDLLDYLLLALELPQAVSRVFEIGGADKVSYADIMKEYAKCRGLKRWMIPVPVLTPRLSSLWLGLVTPIYARVGRALIDSIRHPTVVRDAAALKVFPIRPKGIREAIMAALQNEDRDFAETRWSDALSRGRKGHTVDSERVGPRTIDSRSIHVDALPAAAFAPIRRIGGRTGWYWGDWLWSLRGLLDLLVGGVGIRRGRRDPENLRVGDVVDFWRVEAFEPDRRLRLAAEMKLPGRAWLEFEVLPEREGSVLLQTAMFDPRGLAGLAYWYLLHPLHMLVFAGMLRGIARAIPTHILAGHAGLNKEEPCKE
jgi:uncharacterized protein YbjT (DUF2867 family)